VLPIVRIDRHILIVRGLRAEGAFAWLHHLSRGRRQTQFWDHNRKGHRFRWPLCYSSLHCWQEWCGVVLIAWLLKFFPRWAWGSLARPWRRNGDPPSLGRC